MMRRLGTVQNFTLSATAQLSSPFGPQSRSVLLTSSSTGTGFVGAFVLFGDSTGITATSTNGTLFPAPWVEAFDVSAGQRVSLIEASTQHCTMSVTELT